MNILLTSVGRRSYLAEYFKEALGGDGFVIGANSDPVTTGMDAVDKAYVVPEVHDVNYIPALIEICQMEKVELVLSLFDLDLPFLAREKERFRKIGVTVIVSDPFVIEIVNDKWKTYNFLNENGFISPKTFINTNNAINAIKNVSVTFPLIIKPRWGMGSIGLFKVDNREELEFFYEYSKKKIINSYLSVLSQDDIENSVIIQEYIGGEEYGVDVFNSLEGRHLVTVVKKKLAMRAGETDIAEVIQDQRIETEANKVGYLLKHVGNLDIDILSNKNKTYILEMNARFGGHYPFSHLAGVNFPKAIIEMNKGNSFSEYLKVKEYNIKGLKYLNPKVFNANIVGWNR